MEADQPGVTVSEVCRRHALAVSVELASQRGVRGEELAQLHEGAHDVDAHGNDPRGFKHVGGLDRAMLGECVGPVLDVLAAATVQGRKLRP